MKTVAQLIKQLSRFDEDTPVMVHNPRGELAELEEVKNAHAFFLRIMEIVPAGLSLWIALIQARAARRSLSRFARYYLRSQDGNQ
jgi:hypothetical protein